MVRRLLQFIIIYAVIAIAASAVFIGVQNVMSRTYSPEKSDVFKNGEEALHIISLSGGQAAVVGRYTTGANAGMLFCKIYDRDGKVLARREFYLSDTQLEISDLIAVGSELKIVCLCTPWNAGADKYGAVFTVGSSSGADSAVYYHGQTAESGTISFERFVAADRTGSCFAGISSGNALLFNADGAQIASVLTDDFSVITDAVSDGSSMLIAGTDAESSLGKTFRYGLCALYDIAGGNASLRWQRSVMNEANVCSAVLDAEPAENGFILTGRTMAVSGDAWQSTNRIDGFIKDSDPTRFHVGADSEKSGATSLFILKYSFDGALTGSAIYNTESNEHIPGIADFGPEDSDRIVMSIYSADEEYAKEYTVTVMRMDSALAPGSTFSFPVNGDTGLLFAQDYSGAGIYLCVIAPGRSTYRILFFTSMDDAINHMETLKKLRPVRDFYFTLNAKAPTLAALGFALMISVSGAARVRRKKSRKSDKSVSGGKNKNSGNNDNSGNNVK